MTAGWFINTPPFPPQPQPTAGWWLEFSANIQGKMGQLLASLNANYTNQGVITAQLQEILGAAFGVMYPKGIVAATELAMVAALNGHLIENGSIATGFPFGVASNFVAAQTQSGIILPTFPNSLSASLSGIQSDAGVIAAAVPGLGASFGALEQPSGIAAGTLFAPSASLSGKQVQTGTLATTLGMISAALIAGEVESGSMATQLQAAAANLAGAEIESGTFAASIMQAIAAIAATTNSYTNGAVQPFAASNTYTLPAGPAAVDYVLLGGGAGGGGNGATGHTVGGGGNGGNWATGTLVIGTDILAGSTITITVGAGGAAGAWQVYAGSAGHVTSIQYTNMSSTLVTISTVAATAGRSVQAGGAPSPASQVIGTGANTLTVNAGVAQTASTNPGSAGHAPGGGGAGSGTTGANAGGAGAIGEAWLWAHS